jgi:hypothetical protein
MKFSGQGLATNVSVGEGTLTLEQRSEDFELPSMLNLGISYDFYVSETDYIRALGNFTSNAFSQDQVGFGLEYSFKDIFQVRGAYKHNLGAADTAFEDDIYTGVAAGFTARVPLSKENKEKRLAIDYAYRATNPFKGTHNIGLRYIY